MDTTTRPCKHNFLGHTPRPSIDYVNYIYMINLLYNNRNVPVLGFSIVLELTVARHFHVPRPPACIPAPDSVNLFLSTDNRRPFIRTLKFSCNFLHSQVTFVDAQIIIFPLSDNEECLLNLTDFVKGSSSSLSSNVLVASTLPLVPETRSRSLEARCYCYVTEPRAHYRRCFWCYWRQC